MQRRFVLPLLASAPFFLPLNAAAQKKLEMLGIALNGASREQIQQAFKAQGIKATREDPKYWHDIYNAQPILEGATQLTMAYLVTGQFAIAAYTLPSQLDTQQVSRVVDMVAAKYGRPTTVRGNYAVGPVTASRNLGPSALIEVYREWPSTTTYINLIDPPILELLKREMEEDKKAAAEQKAKAQSKAF